MISNNFYFVLASNTTINATGNYDLVLHNPLNLDYTVDIVKGGDAIEVVSKTPTQLKINITKAQTDVVVTVHSVQDLASSTVKFNTGYAQYRFSLGNYQDQISYEGGVITIPYSINGYSTNNITVTCDKQTKVEWDEIDTNFTVPFSYADGNYKTFDAFFPPKTRFNTYEGSHTYDMHQVFTNKEFAQYNIYPNLSDDNLNLVQIEVLGDVDLNTVYFGYSMLEGIGINNTMVNADSRTIEITFAPNSSGESRTQTVTISVGGVSYDVVLTQIGNPNGVRFSYDDRMIVPYLNRSNGIIEVNMFLPNNWSVDSPNIRFTPNVTGISQPYVFTSPYVSYNTSTGQWAFRLLYRPSATTDDWLHRPNEQTVQYDIAIYSNDYEEQHNYQLPPIQLTFEATGKIYANGEINIDKNLNVTGEMTFDNNQATGFTVSNLPSWLSADNFTAVYNEDGVGIKTILVENVGQNMLPTEREAEVTITFIRNESGIKRFYLNTLDLKITQDSSLVGNDLYHKTFEDFYLVAPQSNYKSTYEIYIPETKTYLNGYFYEKINLTEFGKTLFDSKVNIFDAVVSDLQLCKEIDYEVNTASSSTIVNYYIYDYSFDNINRWNITEARQPINYYDPRQYIFESIYTYPSTRTNYQLNGVSYGNVENYHKYNITLQAVDNPTMKVTFNGGEGKEYKQQCTKAKFALYYMNVYGGWCWMLFEGNKQIRTESNTQSNYTNNDQETIPYSIQTSSQYELTTLYLKDDESEKLKDLYKSPMVFLHNLDNGDLSRVTVNTKSYTEKTFINQGRKFFTQSITVTTAKDKTTY